MNRDHRGFVVAACHLAEAPETRRGCGGGLPNWASNLNQLRHVPLLSERPPQAADPDLGLLRLHEPGLGVAERRIVVGVVAVAVANRVLTRVVAAVARFGVGLVERISGLGRCCCCC